MSRTWVLRGVAVAVFAVLVGAWALGLAGFGDTASSTDKPTTPVLPNNSTEDDSWRSAVDDEAKPRRTRESRPSRAALTEPSPLTADDPTSDAPGTPPPSSAVPTPDPTDPSSEPPSSSPPSHTPSGPPADECTDLGAVVDCALDPVTGRP